jgi:hypothetical protein
MKSNEVFPSRWLKAADLNPDGENVTIRKVTMEEVGEERERKPVMAFNEIDRELVLNITNWTAIADLSGKDESDDWPGCRIKLIKAKVQYGAKTVDAIRVESADPPKKPVKKLTKRTPESAPVGRELDDDGEEIPF